MRVLPALTVSKFAMKGQLVAHALMGNMAAVHMILVFVVLIKYTAVRKGRHVLTGDVRQ